jgi:hypothetical protein
MKRIGISIVAAVALAGMVFAAGADAHRIKYDSAVSAKYTKPDKKDPYAKGGFTGSVTSEKARCAKARTVTLNLRAADGTTQVVGTDLTDATGAWSLQPSNAAAGTYFAEVSKKVLRKSKKHRHVCKAAISKDVRVK